MPSLRPISLDIRTLAQAARIRTPEVAQALDRIQNAVNTLDTRLMGVLTSQPTSGTAQLNLSSAAQQTLRDSAFDRYSSDRIQITDLDIVSLTADKITAGIIDASLITVTNLQVANITGWDGATIDVGSGMLFDSSGTYTYIANYGILTTGYVIAGAGGMIDVTGLSVVTGGISFTVVNTTRDATFNSLSINGLGGINALGNVSSANGANVTGINPTSITVVNGIVTACS